MAAQRLLQALHWNGAAFGSCNGYKEFVEIVSTYLTTELKTLPPPTQVYYFNLLGPE